MAQQWFLRVHMQTFCDLGSCRLTKNSQFVAISQTHDALTEADKPIRSVVDCMLIFSREANERTLSFSL